MADKSLPQVVPISATIYPWQREALEGIRRKNNMLSLSEALRFVLGSALERPACADGAPVVEVER